MGFLPGFEAGLHRLGIGHIKLQEFPVTVNGGQGFLSCGLVGDIVDEHFIAHAV